MDHERRCCMDTHMRAVRVLGRGAPRCRTPLPTCWRLAIHATATRPHSSTRRPTLLDHCRQRTGEKHEQQTQDGRQRGRGQQPPPDAAARCKRPEPAAASRHRPPSDGAQSQQRAATAIAQRRGRCGTRRIAAAAAIRFAAAARLRWIRCIVIDLVRDARCYSRHRG